MMRVGRFVEQHEHGYGNFNCDRKERIIIGDRLSLTYAFGQRKCVMCHVSLVDNVHVNIALVSIFTCNGGQSYENL